MRDTERDTTRQRGEGDKKGGRVIQRERYNEREIQRARERG